MNPCGMKKAALISGLQFFFLFVFCPLVFAQQISERNEFLVFENGKNLASLNFAGGKDHWTIPNLSPESERYIRVRRSEYYRSGPWDDGDPFDSVVPGTALRLWVWHCPTKTQEGVNNDLVYLEARAKAGYGWISHDITFRIYSADAGADRLVYEETVESEKISDTERKAVFFWEGDLGPYSDYGAADIYFSAEWQTREAVTDEHNVHKVDGFLNQSVLGLAASTTYIDRIEFNWNYISEASNYAIRTGRTAPVMLSGVISDNEFEDNGGLSNIQVSSNIAWTATSDSSWVRITSGGPESGNGTVSFTVDPNPTTSVRDGIITIRANSPYSYSYQDFEVTQEGKPYLAINPPSNRLDQTFHSSEVISVDSNTSWLASTNNSWIKIKSGTPGNGSGTVTYEVNFNSHYQDRKGYIYLDGPEVSKKTHTIYQKGNEKLIVEYGSKGYSSSGGSDGLSVTSNRSWSAHSDSGWINITSGSSGSPGTSTVYYNVSSNSGAEREGKIIVETESGWLDREVVITQSAYTAPYTNISPVSMTVPAGGGSYDINVSSDQGWSVSNLVSWIKVDKTSGANDGAIGVTVDPHESLTSREHTISVGGTPHKVIQEGSVGETDKNGDWIYSEWFGWFYDMGEDWIYHINHGYTNIVHNDAGGINLYDSELDCWFWFSEEYYPNVYKFGVNEGWYYFETDTLEGDRTFARLADEEVIVEENLNYTPIDPELVVPTAPTNLSVEILSPTEIQLNWEDNSHNEDGWIIETADSQGGPWAVLAKLHTPDETAIVIDNLVPGKSYYFQVLAFNNVGDSQRARIAESVSTSVELVFTQQPKDVIANEGDDVIIFGEVNYVSGVKWQWYKNGEAISGETEDLLQLIGLSSNDEGTYFVKAEVNGQIENSTSVTITVNELKQLSFVIHPQTMTVIEGDSVQLKTALSFGTEVERQWYFNGEALLGESSAILNLDNIDLSKAGLYYATARYEGNTIYSNVANVSVLTDPGPTLSDFSIIPQGEFMMGDFFGEGDDDEQPYHAVYLSDYYIQKTEVTNAQVVKVLNWAYQNGLITINHRWIRNIEGDTQILFFLETGEIGFSFDGTQLIVDEGEELLPCVKVLWFGAMAYCHYLTRMNGKLTQAVDLDNWTTDLSATGYRLPTEAEWEKAARGGVEGYRYPLGNSISLNEANFNNNIGRTTPVGSYPESGYGLFDMVGNVEEYTADSWDPNFYSVSEYNNPMAINSERYSPTRGGSYRHSMIYSRVASRIRAYKFYGYPTLGFRVAQSNVSSPISSDIFEIQPQSKSINEGESTQFNCAVNTSESVVYQWFHNCVPIAGETSQTLTIENANSSDSGLYFVKAIYGDRVKYSSTCSLEVESDEWPGIESYSLIPAGEFLMGCPSDELGRCVGEDYIHRVTLSRSFYMQKTEVTWDLWTEVREWALENDYPDLPIGRKGAGYPSGKHPVTDVNWYDVVKWLNAKSERDNLKPAYYMDDAHSVVYREGNHDVSNSQFDYDSNGYRLPTEAEWEYACRADTYTALYSGGITARECEFDVNLDQIGWYCGNTNTTHEVALKMPNDWGLFDMSGNVFEHCWDWRGYYDGDEIDPVGPDSSANFSRIIRGGSFENDAMFCRSAARCNSNRPDFRRWDRGFRIVRNATE